jgi:DNA-binding GntR family transcriptional regulator
MTGPSRVRNRMPPQLSDQAASYVRELIISGQLVPGEYIRQERLAADLGISATPVREGLLALRGEGFVRLEPRRGFVVAALSSQDVRDLFAAEAMIAGELASRAASAVGDEDVKKLRELQDDLDRFAKRRRYDEMEQRNHEFHRYINTLAASPKMAWLLGAGTRYFPRRFYASIRGWPDASLHDHDAIIEALGARDKSGARRAMHDHFVHAGDLLARHRDTVAAPRRPDRVRSR